ncbi:haloacid dehalogenase-like hydrolase [Streptomyces halstedii]|uniref:Haloacid dehalogenase-like hydrolase n=1 Tax=Streptomyces halstedii TaxID=1944 RepID=A0ABS6TLE0_STRHA|nr:HAD hydrolase-like protein [Streptomyces halstedii]MBV7669075.1 haloacid dehalogenase-like hydrolase [Streptomyces halstedii]
MANRGKHGTTHLVWDWNGTLLDDIGAVVGATNAAFAEVDLPPLTLERYRETYCVPIPRFYERLLGRLPTDAEWERMDGLFHRHYTERRAACGLTEGVEELLARWTGAGRSQSLLSMYGHEQLVPTVRGYGIEPHFVRVDGRTGPSGGSKALHMERHFAELEGDGVDPERSVVIGDAVDDAVAAAHVGARAVLYTGGSHSRDSLEAVGVPVVDTLAEAVALAESMDGPPAARRVGGE